jgi:hypothetical protein
MHVSYCDLCGTPLKENNYYMLYTSEPKNTNFNEMNDYYNYLKKVEQGVKEVCPSCKHIFDKIFELKLERLSELANEINFTYNLPSKKNPKERKNEKENK